MQIWKGTGWYEKKKKKDEEMYNHLLQSHIIVRQLIWSNNFEDCRRNENSIYFKKIKKIDEIIQAQT